MLETLSILLAAGADPSVASRAVASSPLWAAIRWSWVEAVERLLEAGADIRRTDANGRSGITYLLQNESLSESDVVTLLQGREP